LLDVQRDLRIKATYIAAIEDADVSAFPNPSFIPGYIRSYARYLSLDPDEVYHRFCAESGFSHATPATPKAQAAHRAAAATGDVSFKLKYPLGEPRRGILPEYPLSALGSLVVLVALVAGLGYGAWNVLQNIQRVQFAPVEDLPLAVADVDPLEAPQPPDLAEAALADLATPVASMDLAELYRQQEADVPILTPRDGPIAAIDPDVVGPLAMRAARINAAGQLAARQLAADAPELANPEIIRAVASGPQSSDEIIAAKVADVLRADAAPPQLVVLVERAAWVRVYLADGTVIFERILEKGESYTPPEGVGTPLIWAGNSGSVYVRVGESLHGPLGVGTHAVRDVVLEADAIAERFSLVDDVPDVISQTIGLGPRQALDDVAIQ
jgi:cytoskeletal protein RodZ